MSTAYLLQHVHDLEVGRDEVKRIGVFSSEARAKEAIERLRSQPEFRDAPDGFTIDRYRLDRDHWDEGYVAMGHEEARAMAKRRLAALVEQGDAGSDP